MIKKKKENEREKFNQALDCVPHCEKKMIPVELARKMMMAKHNAKAYPNKGL